MADAQSFSLRFQPVFAGEAISLEKTWRDANGDSLRMSAFKCYLGNFTFLKNGRIVQTDKKYRLLDLEDEPSLQINFDFPEGAGFDSVSFDLGVDSLTTVAGAMGGDLDPLRGMFWTWQSGYINVKAEGYSSKSRARGGAFSFHLGGFLSPFPAARRAQVAAAPNARIVFDLAPFFQAIDWTRKPNIMSPGKEAARLSDVLAISFRRVLE